MSVGPKVALVYGAHAGAGGLGLQASSALADLGRLCTQVIAVGPGATADPFPSLPAGAEIRQTPTFVTPWVARYTWLRWLQGRRQWLGDTRLGAWAAGQLDAVAPSALYCFTQVALETLRWAQARRMPAVLDSPNGHIRNFAEVYRREARTLTGAAHRGHPTEAMVVRVEEEYALASRIRVSSAWAKQSLMRGGVPAEKILVVPQPLDRARFRPASVQTGGALKRPLRVCFVGSLDLRKGFVYLLRALRALGAGATETVFVGSTGDRPCRRLWEREAAGLPVRLQPGDPVPVYRSSDLFVLPSLEDGFGFVVAEAMACGLPVVVTDQCGAAELVDAGKTGWVIPAGDSAALADALGDAARRRDDLPPMGQRACAAVAAYLESPRTTPFAQLFA